MAREQVFALLVILPVAITVVLTAAPVVAVARAPGDPAAAAVASLTDGAFEDSQRQFESTLTDDADLASLVRYAEVCRATGEFESCREFLAGLVRNGGGSSGPVAALALATRWFGDCDAWWPLHRTALSAAPGDARLHLEVLRATRECGTDATARIGLAELAAQHETHRAWFLASGGLLDLARGDLAVAEVLADSSIAMEPGLALGLALRARVHAEHHEHESALAGLVAAEAAFLSLEAAEAAQWCRAGQADALAFLGRYDEAVAVLETVVAERALAGDRLGEARVLRRLSRALAKGGRYEDALAANERAGQLAAGMNDPWLDMILAEELGQVWFHLGDFPAAAESMQRSRELASALGAVDHGLQVTNNLATVYAVLGDYDQSDAMYRQALAVYEDRGDAYGQLFSCSGLGFNCIDRGDYLGGLGHLQQALALADEVDDKGNIHLHRHALAVVYRELGDLELASLYVTAALELARELDHPGMIAANEAVLGQIDLLQGDLEGGLARSRRAAALYRQIGDKPGLASVYLDLSQAQLEAGRPDSAVFYSRRGAALNHEIGSGLGEAYGLLYASRALLADGRYHAAAAAADSVLVLGQEFASVQLLWQAEAVLGAAAAGERDWERARDHYTVAMSGLEQAQRDLVEEQYKMSFGAGKQSLYEDAIAVEIHASDSDAAATFAIAERSRARALRDELAAAGTSRRALAEAPATLQEAERRLREKIAATLQRIWRTDVDAADRVALEKELLALQAEHDLIIARCHEEFGNHAVSIWPRALDGAAVQREVLTDGDVLVEFFLGERACWCWLVTPVSLTRFELPPRRDLEALVAETRAWFTRPPSSRGGPPAAHAELSRVLLDPLSELESATRLYLVADGVLSHFPFEALLVTGQDGDEYLAERLPVIYLPSASTLPLLAGRERDADTRVLAFAYAATEDTPRPTAAAFAAAATRSQDLAPLPYANDEVAGIAAVYDGRVEVIAGSLATEARFKDADLADASVVHLATHALVDPQHADRSGVVLGADPGGLDDGTLWMPEIRDLPLRADLVVLSTCESAVGEAVPGEGTVTLARAFLDAGAAGVLASLWPVNDRSTCTWMHRFHGALAAGESPGTAARTARLTLIHGDSPALRHPYYWAPFVYIGKDR